MSHDNHPSTSASSQPPNTWTEPPWSGWIETTGDALLILEAARRGLIPRVTRRLVDSERKMITSGSVFVFDEDESGIKRWTDGFFWSPSRILGNFLLYRETEKRGAGHRSARVERETVPEPYDNNVKTENGQSLSRPKSETTRLGIDRQRERSLVGSLTNSYKFKPGGMMKKTFSLTIGGVAQHLISYYKVEDVEQGRLRSPSTLPELASLDISPEYLDKTHFRNPPKVEIGVDGIPRYRGEADDIETSPSMPSQLALPSFDEPPSLSKRSSTKRYDPYSAGSSSGAIAKRPSKTKSKNGLHSRSQDDDPGSPTYTPTPTHPPPPPPHQPSSSGYPESLSATTTATVPYFPHGYYPPPPPTYHVPPVYSPSPYPPPPAHSQQPASPVAPQQTPTPPGAQSMTYSGFSSSADSHGHAHTQTQSTSSSQSQTYGGYYPSHSYGGYAGSGTAGMWPTSAPYGGGSAAYAQGSGRVQKTEREGSV